MLTFLFKTAISRFKNIKSWQNITFKLIERNLQNRSKWCYVCVLCFTCALEKFNHVVVWQQNLFLHHSWSTWAFRANFGRALHGSFRLMAAFVPPSDTCQCYAELLRWVAFCSLLLSSVIVHCFMVSHPVCFFKQCLGGQAFIYSVLVIWCFYFWVIEPLILI